MVRVGLSAVILLSLLVGAAALGALPLRAQSSGQIAHLGSGGTVWLTDVGSGQSSQLVEGEGFSDLRWAPDGQRLLLVANGSLTEGRGEISVLDMDSSGLSTIGDGYAPVWSSDSQQILYVSNFVPSEGSTEQSLRLYNVDDGSVKDLVSQIWVSGLWPIQRVAYSANQQFIAVYVAGLEMEGFVVIVDAAGQTRWEIPDFIYSAGGFDWSPDSQDLVYRDSGQPFMGGEAPSLKVVSVEAQETKRTLDQAGFWPRWSPDGETIAALLWSEDAGFRVMMFAPDGEEPPLLSDEVFGDLWNSQLSWSSDGSALLFTSVEDGQGHVHVIDRNGNLATIAEGQDPEVAWSPDGNQIAMATGEEQARELFVVAADGSGLRKIADGYMPVWRPLGGREPVSAPICGLSLGGTAGVMVLAVGALRTKHSLDRPGRAEHPEEPSRGG
jgi:Tol biopolymer transport system component